MRYIRVAKRAGHDHPPRLSPTAAVFAILLGTLTLKADSGANLSFLRLPSISVGNVCCSVLTADFNGDGKTDIAAAYGTAAISIFLGDGKGNFTRSDMPLNLGAGIVLRGLTASADFNGDNIADLVGITDDTLADNGGGSDLGGVVLLGIGDGSFRAPILLGANVVKAVADFNRDGKLDLLVHPCAGDNGCGFAVRLGNGDGTFQPAGPVTKQPAGDVTWWAVVADFNSDGKPDVVETTLQPRESVGGSVYLWLGNGDGSFGNVIITPLSGRFTLSQLATADFNGDGHPDLAVLVDSSWTVSDFGAAHSVEILLGDGTGNFRLGSTYRVPYPAPLITADFEHAGRIDVAAGFTILTSNGDGTFRTAQSFGQYTLASIVSGGISWVAAGDFKGDGKPGLVGLAGYGLQLSILINETPSSDASANAVSAADYSFSVAPGSIASLFGSGLASAAGQATGPPWPTSLANTSVRVLDAKGVERLAGLLYVSPTQINFLIPPEAAYGFAIFNVAGAQTLPDGTRSTMVQQLAPAFFTLSGTGQGPPAATAVRVQADGSQTPVPVAQCSAVGACTLIPIDVSSGNVYLSLYGTGFRQAQDANCGSPALNSNPVVTFVGPQPTTPGLDQLNLLLPGGLPSGTVTMQCQFMFLPPFPPMVPTIYYGSASFSIAVQ